MKAKVSDQKIRVRTGEVAKEIAAQFPDVLVDMHFDDMPPGVDAIIRVLGTPAATSRAIAEAENLTSELWEIGGIYIQISTSNAVWCRRSGDILGKMQLKAGEEAPRVTLVRRDERGVEYLCYAVDAHTEHDFGEQ